MVDAGLQHFEKAITAKLEGGGKRSCKFFCGTKGAPFTFSLRDCGARVGL